MLHKSSLIALTFLFALFAGGCPEGGINTNDNDAGPPRRDADADVAPDVVVIPCGDGECSAADNEDCTTCPADCLGVACSPVREITVQQYRSEHLNALGGTVLDLRSLTDCENGRIPGYSFCSVLSDWWDGAAISDGGGYLDWATTHVDNELVLYGDGTDDATVIAVGEAAWDLGYTNIYRITGGIAAWNAEGWYRDIAYEGIQRLYYPPAADEYLIDTMPATNYDNCHVTASVNLDTYDFYYGEQLVDNGQALLDVAPDLSNSVLVFFCVNQACVASDEACIAAELMGYQHIFHYKEGTEDWYCPPHSSPTEGLACAAEVSCDP